MYIVEGNIGVGKSTFLSLLKKHCPQLEVLTEPVEDWSKQTFGQSLLANFYENTPRWAYTLETLTMICRSRDHLREQENPNPNRVLERSIYSGHYCFARNSFESGCMTQVEWKIYNEWAKFLIHTRCRTPLGFIYLQADSSICYERVQKRNRESEKSLSIEYMKQIEYWHNQFLVEKKEVSFALQDIPVLVLDCNSDFVDNTKNMETHAKKVQDFLTQTQQIRRPKAPIAACNATCQ